MRYQWKLAACVFIINLATIVYAAESIEGRKSDNRNTRAIILPEKNNLSPQAMVAKIIIPDGLMFGTFTREDGPYLISGNVIVPSGQVAEFGPGCTIFIGGEYTTITVFGKIIMKGSAELPVKIMSAKALPDPWDWDRIYCRSIEKSVFENCVIEHSNYGIVAENSYLDVNNCTFKNNSLYGMVIKNSEIDIARCTFTGGHSIAMNLKSGARVNADSLTFTENVTAISSEEKAVLKMRGGVITKNVNGIVVNSNSSVSIVAVDVTKNRTGIITNLDIPRRMREMVFNNYTDIKITTLDELKKIMKEPQTVRSIVLPNATPEIITGEGFTPGFSALGAPQEATASFIGNVTTGFTYFRPHSLVHPIDKDSSVDSISNTVTYHSALRKQNKYLGEQSNKWYAGIQPDIQIFANGKRGAIDVNMMIDLYGNDWLSTANYLGKNNVNLSMSYGQHLLAFGDFFESGSEASISGRQMTGLKYTGEFIQMGNGEKRVQFKLAAGESEIPKDSGDHELNIFNTDVDTGMSIRQQITYVASSTIKPTKNSAVTIKGLIARDQVEKPLFRKPIADPAAPDPIQAQTGCIDGTVSLFKGKAELFGEIDLGSHDTLTEEDAEETAWYNPQVEDAAPKVFKLLNVNDFKEHYAINAGIKGKMAGYDIVFSGMQIASDYFSAGNPYLETDRRNARLSAEKSFQEKLVTSGEILYERTAISTDPVDRGELNIRGEYPFGENKPSFTAEYNGQLEKSNTTERDESAVFSYKTIQFANVLSIEGKHNLSNGISYSLRYQILYDKDISAHPIEKFEDEGDRVQNTWNGTFSFKIKKLIRNKTTLRAATKFENRDSLHAYAYKIGDQLTINAIDRKLTFVLTGEYSNKKETKFDAEWLFPVYTTYYMAELEMRYTLTSKISLSLKGSYEKSYDEAPGSGENFKATVGGLHLTYLF